MSNNINKMCECENCIFLADFKIGFVGMRKIRFVCKSHALEFIEKVA